MYFQLILFDNSANRTDEDDPEYIELIYAHKFTYDEDKDKFYSNLTREEIDKLDVEKIIHQTCIATTEEETAREIMLEQLDLKEVEHHKTVYYREQHYGGAEEGGWWYHTLRPVKGHPDGRRTAEALEEGLDSHGEGLLLYNEVVEGLHTDVKRPYWS